MKPVLKEGALKVELNVHETATLQKAREIGILLESMHQESGAPLIAAVNAILAENDK